MSNNPLASNFRQPALYTKLLSKGEFWPEDAITLPVTGEVPIYPMTTKDEITLKTPDALMNGQGIVSTIESCCPVINNAWEMPSVDVDLLVIAIRIASFGPTMTIETNCPKCKEENTFDVNLQNILDSLQAPNFNIPLEIDGLKIYLKPQKYFDLNQKRLIEFEEQQLVKALEQAQNEDIDVNIRKEFFDRHFNKLVELNIQSLVSSTKKIVRQDGVEVTDVGFLTEFYNNSKGAITKGIQRRIKEIADSIAIKPFDVKCSNCENEYKIDFTFDYSNFFA